MSVLPAPGRAFAFDVPLAVVGAGACGLCAALAAREAGLDVVVFERDPAPAGNTALSSGMIPAAGTRLQAAAGVEDTPELFAADIVAKTKDRTDPDLVLAIARQSGPTVDWLSALAPVELELVGGFLYPGHSRLRMHAPADRQGATLLAMLRRAAEEAGIEIVTSARVADLFADPDGRVRGVAYERPDGTREEIGCGALVLASNGFGGNRDMVHMHIPEMADALYFGHDGNRGDAVEWGRALGAAVADMTGYQGHGSVAHPHGILITWALMMEGGIQVNAEGRRFSNEHQGYSEQAVAVLCQPGGAAWDLYDARLHALGMEFEDYRQAAAAGAIRQAPTPEALAETCGLPPALAETVAEVQALARGDGACAFGRDFTAKAPLAPPYYAARVTGALFHTQGGLVVDADARVMRADGTPLPNLYAGGGAARGVSGPDVSGYLSGNGLLTATVLGRQAGQAAAHRD